MHPHRDSALFQTDTSGLSRRDWLALAAGSTVLPASGWAQGSAHMPLKIVVPFAPGAGTDAVARLIGQKMAEILDRPVVVENKAGASGAIGALQVAQSAPDGHTLLLVAAPFTTVAATLPQAGYDPVGHFTPVGMIATGPLLWAVNRKLPVNNLKELMTLARSQPGRLNYGSAGAGGINHLVLEQLKLKAGLFITHIPYRGIAPATLDLINGQIDIITGTIPALAPHVREGRIKALAVTSAGRSSALPEIPGMDESGLKGFDVLNYFGLVAPRGTPPNLVQALNAAIAKAVSMPEVRERFARDAIEPATGTPAQLGSFLERDVRGWKAVVAAQKLTIEA
jgi:tripartite-type tricarboxylate transporter receptor subunit TctC